MHRSLLLFLSVLCLVTACEEAVVPKPKAMLRLDYSGGESEEYQADSFIFSHNSLAEVVRSKGGYQLQYPSMKGTLFLNYKAIDGDLETLLSDAQKFAYEHVVKADAIYEQPFINTDNKVYGMFYEVKGDAASQAQFYLTDSTQHFLTGSLYFYSKPNYDSIYPAAAYLQRDIRKLMESLRWR
ncbi:MAG: gliding motility lipoprotein GldD [Flavobacteriaceae bacterium]|nr:gliding motility lipoprotein GldD [Flavobacteriaceae bacterium]MDH3796003.1 gliding motility lipoprotein GldD [Flavobacteriaceae bacterium]